MKIKYFLLLSTIFCLISTKYALAELTLSCSTNDKGKAIVLDSTRPDKTLLVTKLKSKLAQKISNLKNQITTIKANNNLSQQLKQTKLARIKTKLDDVKINLALVKTCRNGLPVVRTQLLVSNARCYNTNLFNDCNFYGSLLVQSESLICAQYRTIVVTKDAIVPVSEVTTDESITGTWDASSDTFPGPGTYVIKLLERNTGSTLCASAKNTYLIDIYGASELIDEEY